MESTSQGPVKKSIQIKLKNTARRGRPRKGVKSEPTKTENMEESKTDEDLVNAAIFKSVGPGEPVHQNQHLKWNHKVNLLGEKVVDPLIHCCEKCTLPILIYGRMIPCKHVFCSDCAKKTEKSCPRCEEPVLRIEQSALGTVFVCNYGGSKHSFDGCRRTYLSQRDLKAHIDHRHLKVSPASEQKTQSRVTTAVKESNSASSATAVTTKSQSTTASSNPIIETYSTASGRQTNLTTESLNHIRQNGVHQMPTKQEPVHQMTRSTPEDQLFQRQREDSHANAMIRQHKPQPPVLGPIHQPQQTHVMPQSQVLGMSQQAGPPQNPQVGPAPPQQSHQQPLGQMPNSSQPPHNLPPPIPQNQPLPMQQHMMGQQPVSSHSNYALQSNIAPMSSRTNLITVQIQDDQNYGLQDMTSYQACIHPGMPPTTFNTSVPPPNPQQFPQLRQPPPVTYSTPPPMSAGGYPPHTMVQPPPSVPNPHNVPPVSHSLPQGAPLSMPRASLAMSTAPPVSLHGHPGGPPPQMPMPGGPVPQQHHPGAPPPPRFPAPHGHFDETQGASYSPGQSPRMQWAGPPPNRGPPPGGAPMHPPPQRPQSDYNQYY